MPVEPRLVPPGPSPGQEADELAGRGDYKAAVVKYRAALEQDPEDLSLRFALGAALSHLGRREETAEQFRRVVELGDPASLDVEVARRWLVRAGLLAERATFASSQATVTGAVPAGKVKGKTESGSGQVSIALRGDEESNKDIAFDTSVKPGEPYEFDQVPPGNYRLTARISETTVWDRKVTVEPGGESVLDLTGEPPGPAAEQK